MMGVARIELATPAMSTPATHANLRFLGKLARETSRFGQSEGDSPIGRVQIEPSDHCRCKLRATGKLGCTKSSRFFADFQLASPSQDSRLQSTYGFGVNR